MGQGRPPVNRRATATPAPRLGHGGLRSESSHPGRLTGTCHSPPCSQSPCPLRCRRPPKNACRHQQRLAAGSARPGRGGGAKRGSNAHTFAARVNTTTQGETDPYPSGEAPIGYKDIIHQRTSDQMLHARSHLWSPLTSTIHSTVGARGLAVSRSRSLGLVPQSRPRPGGITQSHTPPRRSRAHVAPRESSGA